MGFEISVSIGYKDIFDDYDQVELTDLIKDIPTVNSIQIVAYFIAQLHTLERETNLQIEFLRMWLSRLPHYIHAQINQFIINVENDKNSNYTFLDNVSLMIFVENLLELSNDLEILDGLSPEQELYLFKAYLICSQQWIDEQMKGFIPKIEGDNEHIIKILLPTQLPYQEILELKDFRIQFIKAIYFFKFCEKNDLFRGYLEIFLKEYNLNSWKEYLVNLLGLYVRKFESLKTPSVINVEENFPEMIHFLNELSIDIESFEKSKDFLRIREKPIYKIDENNFLFLNLNFLVDKIYQGIQFDLARVLVKNSAIYKGKVIKSPVNFIGVFGDEFSENGLFYGIMDYVFENKYHKLHGEFIKKHIGDGEPDYYIRDKSKVYIFEFKNIFLNAETKHSYNYDKIKAEIFKKLVKNQNGSPKGITQLVNVIEKIRNNDFVSFDDYNYDLVTIYPIVVYVDSSFNLGGINYILNQEFRKQINDKNISRKHKIKDLVLIDLDSFIKFQDLFRDNTFSLNRCFKDYYEYISDRKNIFNRISTFNMFLHNSANKIKYWDSPLMLMEEVGEILPNE